jgi:hypothetical protein
LAAAWRGNSAQIRQGTGRIAAISDELASLFSNAPAILLDRFGYDMSAYDLDEPILTSHHRTAIAASPA